MSKTNGASHDDKSNAQAAEIRQNSTEWEWWVACRSRMLFTADFPVRSSQKWVSVGFVRLLINKRCCWSRDGRYWLHVVSMISAK